MARRTPSSRPESRRVPCIGGVPRQAVRVNALNIVAGAGHWDARVRTFSWLRVIPLKDCENGPKARRAMRVIQDRTALFFCREGSANDTEGLLARSYPLRVRHPRGTSELVRAAAPNDPHPRQLELFLAEVLPWLLFRPIMAFFSTFQKPCDNLTYDKVPALA